MITRQIRSLVVIGATFAISSCWADEPVTRIAFGSCLHQNQGQEIWPSISAQDPQLFLFLGDNIYGDTKDMDVLRAKWAQLLGHPGYQSLKAKCPILATWDDHDYGWNDAGAEYPHRAESQQIFLETFDVPKDREPWSRPGIYDARVFGEAGRRLQIIFLDTRYFRGPLVKLTKRHEWGPYDVNPDKTATLLGEAQWAWFRQQLLEPADARIIVSSIQVLPVDHRWERWENLPHERVRLFSLLAETKPGPVLFLSGDRHLAEFMEMPPSDPLYPGSQVFEVTSSGMNHAQGGKVEEPNRYRVGANFRDLNFGMLTIDWSGATPKIKVMIKDIAGGTVREHQL